MSYKNSDVICHKIRNSFKQIERDVIDGKCPSLYLNGRIMGCLRQKPKEFAQNVHALSVIYQALREGVVITKRDLYYRNVGLFKSQKVADTIVTRIALALNCSRDSLNVIASPKGLFYGANLELHCLRGDAVTYNTTIEALGEAATIPSNHRVNHVRFLSQVKRCIVIEKDAIFTQFTQLGGLEYTLLITGKGYPDYATRNLLHAITKSHPDIPVYALVDSDPHGISIMLTYKLPELAYLGVHLLSHRKGWSELSTRDYQIARNLLNKVSQKIMAREIQRMLFMNMKAEMNVHDDIIAYTKMQLSALESLD